MAAGVETIEDYLSRKTARGSGRGSVRASPREVGGAWYSFPKYKNVISDRKRVAIPKKYEARKRLGKPGKMQMVLAN